MKIKKRGPGLETLTTLLIILGIFAFFFAPLAARGSDGHSPRHERVNAIFISDRITECRLPPWGSAGCLLCTLLLAHDPKGGEDIL